MRGALEDKLCAHFGIVGEEATDEQVFQASAMVIREIMSRLLALERTEKPDKEVHYLSMEFLMGRSLMKNAYNLGVADALIGALEDMGRSAADIFELEPDAGLGNGGLGRLAACYMDSMASEGISATGYTLCYELGIFRQKIEDGKQIEVADNWKSAAESWLIPRYEDTVEVKFGGRVEENWDYFGNCHAELKDYTTVLAVPRDMLIVGYGGNHVNSLRLWEAHSTNSLDMYRFSEGEYVKSMEQRTMAEVITKVLYPADDHIEGKELRLKQQYFFVSATAQTLVREHRRRYGDVRSFADHHVIQINDTHPTLMIPELMRIFMDEDGLGWDEAWDIVSHCMAYTNHTVMSEALETCRRAWCRAWCRAFLRSSARSTAAGALTSASTSPGTARASPRNAVIDGGKVHMATSASRAATWSTASPACTATSSKTTSSTTLHPPAAEVHLCDQRHRPPPLALADQPAARLARARAHRPGLPAQAGGALQPAAKFEHDNEVLLRLQRSRPITSSPSPTICAPRRASS